MFKISFTQHRVTSHHRKYLFSFLLILALVIVSFASLGSQPHVATAAANFVTRSGAQFTLGGQPFYFSGSNTYYLVFKPHSMVDDDLQNAHDMGLRVMRIWGFLDIGSYPDTSQKQTVDNIKDGVYYQYWDSTTNSIKVNTGANGLQMMDYYIWKAGQLNIKLIIPLTNNWKDFGGMDQYLVWLGLTHHDDFYTQPSAINAFENYINQIANRVNPLTGLAYKDDPTIMGWELANEPRCSGSGNFSASSSCTPATITNWANTISTYIKSIDSNHLVGLGDEGFMNKPGNSQWEYNGSQGIDYVANLAVPNLDFGTYHLYPDSWGTSVSWGTQWIADHTSASLAAGKPSIMEEFGIAYGGAATDTQDARNSGYDTWMNQVCAGHGNWMYWMLAARQTAPGTNSPFTGLYPDYDNFTVYYKDFAGTITTSGAKMAGRAATFNSGSCAIAPTATPTASITPGGPTLTPTKTNTPTNTPAPTATPLTTGALKAQIKQSGGDNTQESQFYVKVINTSTNSVSNVSFRMYFTPDNGYAATSYVTEKFGEYINGMNGVQSTVTGPTQVSSTLYYFTFTLGGGTTSLGAGASWEYNARLRLSDWSNNYSAANDWWHTIFSTTYADTIYVPAYVNGVIAWGQAPGGSGGSGGPTPTNTLAAPTNTALPPTNTPLPTFNPPTNTSVPATATTIKTATPIPATTTSAPPTNTPVPATATKTNTPAATSTGAAMHVEALLAVNSNQETQYHVQLHNDSAQSQTNLKVRVYLNMTDEYANGFTAADVVTESFWSQCGTLTFGPITAYDVNRKIYYMDVNWGSYAIPAGASCEDQFRFRLSGWQNLWGGSDDYSAQGLNASTMVRTQNMSILQNNTLIYGILP